MFEIEREYCQPNVDAIQNELIYLKNSVKSYMDANDIEEENNKFTIQFFNLNVDEIKRQNEALAEALKIEQNKLDKQLNEKTFHIKKIQKYLFNCFKIERLRVCGIFKDIFIENYALTHLDRKIVNAEVIMGIKRNSELRKRISKLEPGIRYNYLIEDELNWFGFSADYCSEGIERFTAAVSKIIDLHLSTQISWTHDFSSIALTECHIDDITDENLINLYNIKIYVRTSFRILFSVEEIS